MSDGQTEACEAATVPATLSLFAQVKAIFAAHPEATGVHQAILLLAAAVDHLETKARERR